MAIKISEIRDPVFEIELPGGGLKQLDPWKVAEQLEKVTEGDGVYDNIRVSFGFPTEAEVASSAVEPKPHLLSRNQCLALKVELYKFIDGMEITKKLKGFRQG